MTQPPKACKKAQALIQWQCREPYGESVQFESRSTPQSAVTGAKPRSAFDFQRRADRETREQAQSQALQELRQQQKERYKAEGAGTGTNRTPTASASAPPTTPASDGCALQLRRRLLAL
eukprot:s2333_g5.t1